MGGNIGLPLVEYVDQIQPDDLVVVEFSSFQLELMTTSPQIGAVLNITPNHLDRHGTMEAYTAAKARILQFQTAQDIAVLNREDPGAWGLRAMVRGKLVTFGLNRPETSRPGTYATGSSQADRLYFFDGQHDQELMSREPDPPARRAQPAQCAGRLRDRLRRRLSGGVHPGRCARF